MTKERGLDLDRADAMVGDLDDLVGAAAEPHVAVLVDRRRVPGEVHGLSGDLVPVVARVALGLRPEPRGETGERTLDHEDSLLIRPKLLAILIDHGRLDPGDRPAPRAWLD